MTSVTFFWQDDGAVVVREGGGIGANVGGGEGGGGGGPNVGGAENKGGCGSGMAAPRDGILQC